MYEYSRHRGLARHEDLLSHRRERQKKAGGEQDKKKYLTQHYFYCRITFL
jgi:hypothetical protein